MHVQYISFIFFPYFFFKFTLKSTKKKKIQRR